MYFEKKFYVRVFLSLLLVCGSFFVLARIILAEEEDGKEKQETATLLISEIQLGSAAAEDEFIELYNPNLYSVSLEGWSL